MSTRPRHRALAILTKWVRVRCQLAIGLEERVYVEPGSSESSGSGISAPQDCSPGTTIPCYSGPDLTEGVGRCVGGTATCNAGGIFGACQGEIVPAPEDCATP